MKNSLEEEIFSLTVSREQEFESRETIFFSPLLLQNVKESSATGATSVQSIDFNCILIIAIFSRRLAGKKERKQLDQTRQKIFLLLAAELFFQVVFFIRSLSLFLSVARVHVKME